MKIFHLSTGFAGHAEAATLTDLQLHLQPGLFWEVLPHRCVRRHFSTSEKQPIVPSNNAWISGRKYICGETKD